MKKIIKLGIIAFISMLCLTSLMSFVNSQETLPELLTPPTYTYDQGVYTEYATSDNNYRVFLSKTKETIADMIAMSLSIPSIKTKYSFNQFYFDFLLDSQNHYSDTYANAIKPVFDFYVPDTSGNPYYRGKLEMEFRTNDVKVIVYESYYSGTWSTYVATTLKTITYTDYYLNSSTLNNIEFGIHLRLETSGSDTILKSQIDLYMNDNKTDTLSYNIETYSSLTRDKVYTYSARQPDLYLWYNSWIGYRSLYYGSTDELDGFLEIPNFFEFVNIQLPEKQIPLTYWTYLSYALDTDTTLNVSLYQWTEFMSEPYLVNFSYQFTTIKGITYTAKFYYSIAIVEFSGNWFLDCFIFLANCLLLGLQFLLYLLVAGLNLLIVSWCVLLLLPFLYNVVCYWLLYGLVFVLMYAYVGIILLVGLILTGLLYLVNWFIIDALPWIIDVLIYLLSWIFAILLFVLTLGQGNILELQYLISMFLEQIADFFISSTFFIITYLPELLLYSIFYLVLIGFTFLKLEYVKARGYVNRSLQLDASLQVYIVPVKVGKNLIVSIKEMIIGWW